MAMVDSSRAPRYVVVAVALFQLLVIADAGFAQTERPDQPIEDRHVDGGLAALTRAVSNNHPVAVPDMVELTDYLACPIAVLDNDIDDDGDDLSVVDVSEPPLGHAVLEEPSVVVFTPPKGWTGSTSFTYVVSDSSGARAEGVVSVAMSSAALIEARTLSKSLGTNALKVDSARSAVGPRTDVALSPLIGLQLFGEAFFQSLDGIEISIALLGLIAVVLMTVSLASRLPLILPLGSTRYWSAVAVDREDQLEIRSKPRRSSEVIYQLRPTTKGVESAVGPRLVPPGWLPIETPLGTGWAESRFLTEQVDSQTFMEDQRPAVLVHRLARRLSRGSSIAGLVSSRGLMLNVGEGLDLIDPGALPKLSRRGAHRNGHSPLAANFRTAIAAPFLRAYRDSGEIHPQNSHAPHVLLPSEVLNFRYLSVGGDDTETWLVFFEYEKSKPRIVGLLRDE